MDREPQLELGAGLMGKALLVSYLRQKQRRRHLAIHAQQLRTWRRTPGKIALSQAVPCRICDNT